MGELSGLPEQIGDYRLRGLIGNGGMGIVYQAEHVGSGQSVALKTVRIPDPSYLSSIRREIQALSQVDHPGVVRILAEGVIGGIPWYAMELLVGRTFSELLHEVWPWPTLGRGSARRTAPEDNTPTMAAQPRARRDGSGPGGSRPGAISLDGRPVAGSGRLPDLLTTLARLCVPLAFLHGEGIVHRDLTPANVFLRPDGSVVIMDFGLVWRHAGGVGREVLETGLALAGTTGYMSPEQVRGEQLDARSDLYSLGCVLYKAITGKLPFVGDEPAVVLQMTLSDPPEPPSTLCEGVPPALDELVLRLLAKRPRDRLGHATDVAAVLADLGADLGERGAEPARAYLYHPELGGRDEVRNRLRDHVNRAVIGDGSIVLIRGESGIGKTLLASEVARVARTAGMTVVTGECIPLGAGTAPDGIHRGRGALQPLRGLLQLIADLCIEGGVTTTNRLLGPRGKLLASFEPTLHGLPGQDAYSQPTYVAQQDARPRLLDAIADTLLALARDTPLLLILDDLQWADELTLALLATLPDRYFAGQRLQIVLTCRSDEMTDEVGAIAQRRDASSFELGRLDEQTVAHLVRDMLAMPTPPRELVRFLATVSEGNPFFVAEYLRTAVTESLLFRDARGEWKLRPAEKDAPPGFPLPLPRSLHDLIHRRLGALSDAALALVELAAVIGREVEIELLGDGGLPDPVPLRELIQRQIVEVTRGGDIRFLHDKLREAVHGAIAPARRRTLHRRVAVYLEQLGSGPSLLPRLAHHFTEAADPARAIDYLEKAGTQALHTSANGDAAAFLRRALELDATLPTPSSTLRRARWERQLGDACMLLGDSDECRRHLEAAARLLGWPVPSSKRGLIASVARQVARQTAHRLLPSRFLASRREHAETLLEGARTYDRLMQNRFFAGEALPIMDAMLRTLNLSELAGPSPELGLAYGNAHGVAYLIPARSLAVAYVQRAYQTIERSPDPATETWVRNLHAIYLLGIGDWQATRDCADASAALAEPIGLRRRWEETRGILGHLELFRGALDRARIHFNAQLESATRRDPTVESWALLGLSQLHLLIGDADGGRALLERAMGLLVHKLGKTEEAPIYGTLALAHLRLGHRDEARSFADRAAAIIRNGQPGAFWCIQPTASVAEVYLTLARDSRATRKLAAEACAAVHRTARIFPIAGPRAWLRQGQLERLDGRPDHARRAFARAAALAAELGLPPDQHLAEQELARPGEP